MVLLSMPPVAPLMKPLLMPVDCHFSVCCRGHGHWSHAALMLKLPLLQLVDNVAVAAG